MDVSEVIASTSFDVLVKSLLPSERCMNIR
jgi:hypothetical protein